MGIQCQFAVEVSASTDWHDHYNAVSERLFRLSLASASGWDWLMLLLAHTHSGLDAVRV
jgi:hypothetical protein